MLQYKQEFGEGFELGFELGHFPFLQDKSWHNDVCPSFMFKALIDLNNPDLNQSKQKEQYLVLWVDYENGGDRENTTTSRYSIVTATNLGSLHEPEIYHNESSITVFEAEDPKALTQYLSALSTLSISETS
ncbi:hypothetical protein [Shewanella woodyi]|uniref:Uncharacterized protein n=1 Tax=Shewanella woodyi (strain ATCC 51908 / MS32) TaxID=392500 RepID=B1KQ57_SHEWM|nr:hypothetical protein [Shewanella woodyi]ACA89170.1 conserved hypothetical protein [Shewanella woodyi ATCC 51908]